MIKKRILALLMGLTILFSGCGGDKSAGQIFRYDIAGKITSLDPQYATDSAARMIISNTFEGLLQQLPSGEIVPCIAKSYEVSADGLVYTFHLREDARWSDSQTATSKREAKEATPVTAHDFAFALSRMFDPTAFSPFAGDFSSISNASRILNGTADRSSLGVKALDTKTLEITLIRPDSHLPELLSASYAMPCNQAFFESTRARYGLDTKHLIFNGPFYVRAWNNDKVVSLRQNKDYVSPVPTVAGGVDFYIPARMAATDSNDTTSGKAYDPTTRFLAGSTDACKLPYELLPAVTAQDGTYAAFEDTVWVLVFNQRKEYPAADGAVQTYYANANIRKAFATVIDRSLFPAEYLPANLRPTDVLIPPVITSPDSSFRDFSGDNSPIDFDPALALQYYRAGLAELGLTSLPLGEILIGDDSSLPLLAGYVQQNFQKYLSLSTGTVKLPRDELLKRVLAGDYEAAIIPLTAAYSSPDAIFSYFRGDSGQNFSGYQNDAFDTLITALPTQNAAQYAVYAKAERLLLDDCVVIPLFFETTYYATAKGVSDITFSPFLAGASFKLARKLK